MVDAITPVLLVKVDNSFGIATGAIAVSCGLKVGTQFLMVVNLAVEDDPYAFVLVGEGLMSGLHVDDAEAAHSQANAPLDEQAPVVRPAMNDLAVHCSQTLALNSRVAFRQKYSANSAHKITRSGAASRQASVLRL